MPSNAFEFERNVPELVTRRGLLKSAGALALGGGVACAGGTGTEIFGSGKSLFAFVGTYEFAARPGGQ